MSRSKWNSRSHVFLMPNHGVSPAAPNDQLHRRNHRYLGASREVKPSSVCLKKWEENETRMVPLNGWALQKWRERVCQEEILAYSDPSVHLIPKNTSYYDPFGLATPRPINPGNPPMVRWFLLAWPVASCCKDCAIRWAAAVSIPQMADARQCGESS